MMIRSLMIMIINQNNLLLSMGRIAHLVWMTYSIIDVVMIEMRLVSNLNKIY